MPKSLRCKIKHLCHNGTFTERECDRILKALEQQPSEDCRNCKKWNECPCGKAGHENGTSIGYSIGECKDYEPSEDTEVIKVSKGAVKARQGRFVIYDVDWLRENFYTTEEKIYGQPKQPSEDCISREEAINEADNLSLETSYDNEKVEQMLRDLPPVIPQRKKGKWIETPVENDVVTFVFKCSECGKRVVNPYDYCPNCGAEMSGGGEE